MGRQAPVARSIVTALTASTTDHANGKPTSPLRRLFAFLGFLFSFYQLPLFRTAAALFLMLRRESWKIEDDSYAQSFQPQSGAPKDSALKPIGDMGFSGSTFFATADQRYLIKSVPRAFEHTFFRDDLLGPYATHMAAYPQSLLIRICDFLAAPKWTVGGALGLTPTHHIVMENLLYGKEKSEAQNDAADATGPINLEAGHISKDGRDHSIGQHDIQACRWENWDLKPQSYFFPERDIAQGKLTSDATKDRLADEFNGKLLLTHAQASDFISQLEIDTQLLADYNAVDYSLFLVRISPEVEAEIEPMIELGAAGDESDDQETLLSSSPAGKGIQVPVDPVSVPPLPPTWRTGIHAASTDSPLSGQKGAVVYRAAILDFFWAKHKTQPRIMTALINLWNILISRQGHMSITTQPGEYRTRFLRMCQEMIQVTEEREELASRDGGESASR